MMPCRLHELLNQRQSDATTFSWLQQRHSHLRWLMHSANEVTASAAYQIVLSAQFSDVDRSAPAALPKNLLCQMLEPFWTRIIVVL
jgi:hypothetical protein